MLRSRIAISALAMTVLSHYVHAEKPSASVRERIAAFEKKESTANTNESTEVSPSILALEARIQKTKERTEKESPSAFMQLLKKEKETHAQTIGALTAEYEKVVATLKEELAKERESLKKALTALKLSSATRANVSQLQKDLAEQKETVARLKAELIEAQRSQKTSDVEGTAKSSTSLDNESHDPSTVSEPVQEVSRVSLDADKGTNKLEESSIAIPDKTTKTCQELVSTVGRTLKEKSLYTRAITKKNRNRMDSPQMAGESFCIDVLTRIIGNLDNVHALHTLRPMKGDILTFLEANMDKNSRKIIPAKNRIAKL